MKLVVNIDSRNEREKLKNYLKKYPGKLLIRSSTRPIESLIAFAEHNACRIEKVDIPSRNERNER